jgi:hypothetical protein
MNRKLLAALLALMILIIALPWLSPRPSNTAPPPTHGMPWQIELPASGQSRVFHLTLAVNGGSTLPDARRQFPGVEPKLALLAPKDAALALEAYFDNITAGPLGGKLVVSFALPVAELDAMRERAVKTDFLGSGTRTYTLGAADRQRVETLPLAGINFIPAASLDEAIVLQRFGTPAERIRQGETLEHFLYPEKGLDVVLDSKGKEVRAALAIRPPARTARKVSPQ